MSEANKEGLPPRPAGDEVSADVGHAPARGPEVDAKEKTSKRRGARMSSVRLDERRAAKLDRIMGALGIKSDAEALRDLIDFVDQALDAPSLGRIRARLSKAMEARRPVVRVVDREWVAALHERMVSIDEHRERTEYLVKKASDNENQIAMVANARQDVDMTTTKAIQQNNRLLSAIHREVSAWKRDDARRRGVVASLRSST